MEYFNLTLIFLFGLVAGSFISALSWRIAKGVSIKRGRSFCDSCKGKIDWYDNIPVASYILLGGKCRRCKNHISIRYPLIELATGILFVVSGYSILYCSNRCINGLSFFNNMSAYFVLAFVLFFVSALITVFITDFEHQIIPDELVFYMLILTSIFVLLSSTEKIYEIMFTGLVVSVFFLFLHFVTRGKGMGLGDVKLVIPLSMVLGWQLSLVWLFISFVLGAVIGILLLLIKKAKFGKQIAFGPFLVVGFLISVYFGGRFWKMLFLGF